jgi:hypothetical protein
MIKQMISFLEIWKLSIYCAKIVESMNYFFIENSRFFRSLYMLETRPMFDARIRSNFALSKKNTL